MEYKLNMGVWGKVFAVPDCVVDKYLKLARGSDLKVLLYIMHNNSQAINIDIISKELDIAKDTVEEAFLFWEQVGLLNKNEQPNNKKSEVVEEKIEIQPPQKEKIKRNSVVTISPREIAARIEQSDEMKYLFEYAEKTYGDTLTNTQQRSLIWLRDYLDMPVDVIQLLMEYCKTIGKLNVNYIEKVAISWCEREIITHEKVEAEIEKCLKNRTYSSKVMSAFGINRKLTSKEEEFINSWNECGYDLELISFAYEKTIDAINKLSFPYINKILIGWHEKGLFTKDIIVNSEKGYNKEKESGKHSYDLDKFEKLAVNVISNSNGG